MSKDFKEIGENIQQRRQELNLSIREVENATSIRTSHLQAIENGEMNKLISPVYAEGFVRQYSAFLGLDSDSLIREHPEIFARGNSQEFSFGLGTIEVRDNPGAGVKWIPNALWVVAFVGLFVAAWYIAKYFEVE